MVIRVMVNKRLAYEQKACLLAAATLLAAHGRCRRVLQSLPRQLATSVSPAPVPPILSQAQDREAPD